ncbi:nicotinate (nicotinamide) nucleotide adenylyltransferase [archaeon]|nr:nicotinate (nicotinamide) nucleotide adenylyltransferase [archaeon]
MRSFSEYARKRIAVFGGSFNPFHDGHLAVVKCLARNFRQVWVMPCNNHAFGKELAPIQDRYRMCVLGTMGVLMTSVSRFEMESGGISYTANTVKRLRRKYPTTNFSFVISENSLKDFDKWREAEALKAEVDFIVVSRKPKKLEFGYNLVCDSPKLSSTQLRKKVSSGKDLHTFVPKSVAEYVQEHKLYH